MKPQNSRGRRYAPRRGGVSRYLLAALTGAACVLVVLALGNRLWAAAANNGEDGPSAALSAAPSPSPAAKKGISVSSAPEDAVQTDDWQLRLVNRDNPLPRDFTVELAQVEGGQFDARAAEALSQMLADMEAQGLEPLICSSFRTWEDQESLHQNKIDRLLAEGYSPEQAQEEAARWVVPAGASEHQLGLAADIVAASYQMLEEEQEGTPEQQWLMAHCAEYGFILRYPRDKEGVTGVGYEPWHYRYVGQTAAREITGQGLCLEEYLQ